MARPQPPHIPISSSRLGLRSEQGALGGHEAAHQLARLEEPHLLLLLLLKEGG
jgi:hypothetical protein